MNEKPQHPGIDDYYQAIQALQERAIAGQRELLSRAAERMAETIGQDGRIFVFGTGHSHMMAEEAFYRAGGLAPVVPIFATMLMLHENAALGALLERTPGLAGALLDGYGPRAGETLIIFSNSGVNQMPVEMAEEAKRRGLFVISISSFSFARVAPLSATGKRLDEVAHLAIDNCGEPGDALVPISGSAWRAGSSSTVIGALIWNCLLTETAYLLQQAGIAPPLFISLNMPGAAEHNAALLAKWQKVDKHL